MQLVTLAPVSPGYAEPCVVLGCQDYTIRVLERSTLIHQVQRTLPFTFLCMLTPFLDEWKPTVMLNICNHTSVLYLAADGHRVVSLIKG